jgi:hypothetical protein
MYVAPEDLQADESSQYRYVEAVWNEWFARAHNLMEGQLFASTLMRTRIYADEQTERPCIS